jgi:hypothetical protein
MLPKSRQKKLIPMKKIYFRKTKVSLQLLMVSMLLFTFNLSAQCPSGGVTLNTQAQVNQFAIDYPNCTTITGSLFISGIGNSPTNITDLSPLNKITTIGGFFQLYLNPLLTNINGLSNLKIISSYLLIDNNFTSITQDINILNNAVLNDISALKNTTFAPADGYGLTIFNNPALSVCNLPNFCSYLANPQATYPRDISGNLTTCLNEAAVKTACGIMAVTDIGKSNITVYPNPVKSVLNFSEEVSNIRISDISGRTVKQIPTSAKSVDVATLENGTYIITATTKAGNTITKKLVKE